MLIAQIILSGTFATIIMDLCASFLAKRKIIHPFITQNELGRWFLYLFKGKYFHQNITTTPPLKNEKLWCFISHYLIGIVLTGFYFGMELKFPWMKNQFWLPIFYGFVTVIFPWFWLLPSINMGFVAAKSEQRSKIIRTNITNHTVFGLGILLWMILIKPLFP
ncbi:DUF2938 family protein [Draconibacterium sediminis]|uniref:DUF2938 domain-containing protein n=1 Tax=Draconibacterium sediminis TaxID=1544798 RepID=A0A0D8J5C7_9BACT|nr:DUF2938 family protein [Draconibacterium sediminis]KJF42175.1 hypothetical protein LH29_20440 [Draconibacterium sediminis]